MIDALNLFALIIGYAVICSGGIAMLAFITYFPCTYAWKRFGDTAALVAVMREAKKQGRKIWREAP